MRPADELCNASFMAAAFPEAASSIRVEDWEVNNMKLCCIRLHDTLGMLCKLFQHPDVNHVLGSIRHQLKVKFINTWSAVLGLVEAVKECLLSVYEFLVQVETGKVIHAFEDRKVVLLLHFMATLDLQLPLFGGTLASTSLEVHLNMCTTNVSNLVFILCQWIQNGLIFLLANTFAWALIFLCYQSIRQEREHQKQHCVHPDVVGGAELNP